jgi:acetyl-CoA synthetase
MGASGGDMAMTADVAREMELDFAPIPPIPAANLQELLTTRVSIANPLDIHTYLWFDPPALQRVFSEVLHAGYDAAAFMLDSPPPHKADPASYDAVIDAFIEAARGAPTRAALMASLPETMSEDVRRRCVDGGIVPLQGQREALEALSLAGAVGAAWLGGAGARLQLPSTPLSKATPLSRATPLSKATTELSPTAIDALGEHQGKAALAAYGLHVPRGRLVAAALVAETAAALGFPVVIKATGAHLEHKTEVGGVVLNVRSEADARSAALRLSRLSDTLLVEEMFTDGVAEILIGLILDPQFGQVLVLGSGGVFTEILSDSVSLLPPWTRESIAAALSRLSVARVFAGYRGKPAADVDALIDAIVAVGRYASEHVAALIELDVNPVIVRPRGKGAVAVDVLIRLKRTERVT